MKQRDRRECYVCGSKSNTERHHIDFNHKNNAPSNLMWLCRRCHTQVNQCGYTNREEFGAIRGQVKARDPGRFARLPMFED
jgi:5-methylcytosine-specific restriction endonuclease McrA